jgi:hypothetical protein
MRKWIITTYINGVRVSQEVCQDSLEAALETAQYRVDQHGYGAEAKIEEVLVQGVIEFAPQA